MTNAELKTAVAATMQVEEASLNDTWDSICVKAVARAKQQLRTIFGQLGYSWTILDVSDEVTNYHPAASLYWAFVFGAGLHNYEDRWIEKLNPKTELKAVSILHDDDGTELNQDKTENIVYAGSLDWSEMDFNPDTRITLPDSAKEGREYSQGTF